MPGEHVVRLETRPPTPDGLPEVGVRDLVRAALRMRPDRLVVGEVRGPEALDMLQAMNTGHDGSLSTAHANSARHLLWRLETMALMSDVDLPASYVRAQVASAVDLVVHLARLRNGRRVVFQIASVEGLGDDGDPVVTEVFGFRPHLGPDGTFVATGARPAFERTIHNRGEHQPDEWFVPGPDVRTGAA
jgi:pilus assembly protein CpaF